MIVNCLLFSMMSRHWDELICHAFISVSALNPSPWVSAKDLETPANCGCTATHLLRDLQQGQLQQ